METTYLFVRVAVCAGFALSIGPSVGLAGRAKQPERSPGKAAFDTRLLVPPDAGQNKTKGQIQARYGELPLMFELNLGQTDPRVQYLARGAGYTLFLTRTEAVMVLQSPGLPVRRKGYTRELNLTEKSNPETPAVVGMQLLGSLRQPSVEGQDKHQGVSNYFIGNDPKKWRTNVPNYGRVRYSDVYAGIDLVYYGQGRQLEYDFVVRPGADPKQIRIAYTGAETLHINAQGDLVLKVKGRELVQHRPVVYQEIAAKRVIVEAEVRLEGQQVGFLLARYDHSRPVIIDPVLSYSTFLGGSSGETGNGIAVDSNGCAYVAGSTTSLDFPTGNAVQSSFGGGRDAFVTRLSASGGFSYATYLGGTGVDAANGIAVDGTGNAYVTGQTNSFNFPTFNASQSAKKGSEFIEDGFVTKLSASGSILVYSTYLGGSGRDAAKAIAVDGDGNAYVTGDTYSSTDFPLVNAFQSVRCFCSGSSTAFVTKLSATGNSLLYSTYFGDNTSANGIAVDNSGNAYFAGSVGRDGYFPTHNAFQTSHGGYHSDAFVAKLSANGANLMYSTYLGGVDYDEARGIAIDGSGNAYVAGITHSGNFPTLNAIQSTAIGGVFSPSAFVTKLTNSGNALVYSTFLGDGSLALAIAVSISGNAYVVGRGSSPDFPTINAVQGASRGSTDAFVAKLSTGGAALLYSTFLGGAGQDEANAIAIDGSGDAYVSGVTYSANFPTLNGSQSIHRGSTDAFVFKLSDANQSSCSYSLNSSQSSFAAGAASTSLSLTASRVDCLWTLISDSSWAQLSHTSGSGYASIGLTLPANHTTTERTARLTLRDGQGSIAVLFSITQVALAFTVSPELAHFSAGGGTGSLVLTSNSPTYPWAATTGEAWISITTGAIGTGTAGVNYTVAANLGISPRTGTVTIVGQPITQTLTIYQRAQPTPAKVGIFRSGFFWLEDVDGNHQFTLPADRAFAFGGIPGDIPITGDWTGNGITKVGVYRSSNGLFVLDWDGDGQFTISDKFYTLGLSTEAGDVPVIGDWNGDGRSKIGIFRRGFFWILDQDGDGIFDPLGNDTRHAFGGLPGDKPVVGDWNGDGKSKMGLFRSGYFWVLDSNGNGLLDRVNQSGGDQAFPFGGLSGDVPVVGDWNGDGKSKVGVFRAGFFWVLDGNGDHQFTGTISGHDQAFGFGGLPGDQPVTGKRW